MSIKRLEIPSFLFLSRTVLTGASFFQRYSMTDHGDCKCSMQLSDVKMDSKLSNHHVINDMFPQHSMKRLIKTQIVMLTYPFHFHSLKSQIKIRDAKSTPVLKLSTSNILRISDLRGITFSTLTVC